MPVRDARRVRGSMRTMASMAARLGTFDELLGIAKEPMRPILTRLRETILAVHPEAYETVRLGDRAATYGLGPRKMIDGYAYVMPHSEWVNLGFFQGASLSDPHGLLEGNGAKLRHVKIRSTADADRPEIRELIAAAVAERNRALHK